MRWIDAPTPKTALLPGYHPLVEACLIRRGFSDPEAARAFLDPNLYTPTPASALPGVQAAVERIGRAVRKHEPICIWGDFDVDGQTATAVLVQTLRAMGAQVSYHLPVRSRESHGVNIKYLEEILDGGVRLLITCDTGITAHEATEFTRSRGVDMIITDHHDLPAHIPQTLAVINPKMLPSEHPLATLAGVGVAYKLAEALLSASNADLRAEELLDLVALGLVADLAILRADTRYLVQRGLEALRATHRPGLLAMFDLAELQPETINESHIGFTLAPRLNSLGRIGDANPVIDFLLSNDQERARVLANQLENYNARRKLLTSQVTQAAESLLRAEPSRLTAPIIIVGHPEWPSSVLGIAAARLVEHYGKPALVLSTPPGEPAYGSARSVDGLHITKAISAVSDLLYGFGGHPMAAGLSIAPENLPAFSTRLVKTVERMFSENRQAEPSLQLDAWLTLPELNLELAQNLEQMAPFGPGNPKLTLASRNLALELAVPFGRNKEHVNLNVIDEVGNTYQVTWWDGGGEPLPEGRFDLAYTLRATNWRGKVLAQLELVGFRRIEVDTLVIHNRKLNVIDYRKDVDRDAILALASQQESIIIWAEGEEKKRLGAKDRNELTPADTLLIWSMPPSRDELQAALACVHPHNVWLVAADPPGEVTENFIARMTGLLKYAITHRQGEATYAELAVATGQRLATVERGLNWLVSHGNISIKRQEGTHFWLGPGKTINDLGGSARLYVEVQSLLAETAAYRAHFKRADKDSLFS
jgi:single-stranded-DNA-specific exonuclease